MLAGCFPYVTSYVYLTASEGSAVPGACGNRAGPPVFARYERKGARFEVTLEPGIAERKQVGYMAVRAAAHVTITIPETSGYVTPGDGSPRIPIRLVPASATVSPAGTQLQRFEFEGLPARIDFSGTLHLPDVYLDGQEVISPVFTFSRQGYFGVLPFNC